MPLNFFLLFLCVSGDVSEVANTTHSNTCREVGREEAKECMYPWACLLLRPPRLSRPVSCFSTALLAFAALPCRTSGGPSARRNSFFQIFFLDDSYSARYIFFFFVFLVDFSGVTLRHWPKKMKKERCSLHRALHPSKRLLTMTPLFGLMSPTPMTLKLLAASPFNSCFWLFFGHFFTLSFVEWLSDMNALHEWKEAVYTPVHIYAYGRTCVVSGDTNCWGLLRYFKSP